jgi:hypothetical protein
LEYRPNCTLGFGDVVFLPQGHSIVALKHVAELFELFVSQKSVIRHPKVTILPITTSVIEAVEGLAKADSMTGLVLNSKDGSKFYDSSWIAGVDYTQNENKNEVYDDIFEDSDYEQEDEEQEEDLVY